MLPSRHRVFIRILTLLLLLWVGFDIGAHGLLASDLGPMAPCGSAAATDGGGAGADGARTHCHCFCHAVSVGAVLPALVEGLAPANAIVLAPSADVPPSDADPLDHPPQLNL